MYRSKTKLGRQRDRKLIALKEVHEVSYIRAIAKNFLRAKNFTISWEGEPDTDKIGSKQLKRLAKAFLKISKVKRK